MSDFRTQPMTATQIYADALDRAQRDHIDMVDDFMSWKLDVASPCFDDRLREYLIKAFDAALEAKHD